MVASVPAWEIATQFLNNCLSKVQVTKPTNEDKESVAFFQSKRGHLAIEMPRGTRPKKGAKFWLSYKPTLPPGIFVESKSPGDGRNSNLAGSSLRNEFPVWTTLIRDSGLQKNDQIKAIVSDFVGSKFNGSTERENLVNTNPSVPSVSETPCPADIAGPSERQQVTVYRILRDTILSKEVKSLHRYQCQICGHTIVLPNGSRYAEAHHIQPLGEPHNGPDRKDNLVCLCPNHHAELDYGVRPLLLADLRRVDGHSVSETYLRYHNEVIRKSES